MKPYDRQQPWHVCTSTEKHVRQQFKRTASSPPWSTTSRATASQPLRARTATPLSDPSRDTDGYNTSRNQLPSAEPYHSILTVVDATRREMRPVTAHEDDGQSIRIYTAALNADTCLNLYGTLLIPCASLLTVSRTVNFLFKVLFIFPSRYLFAIGLVPIFSFRRSLPPILG